MPEDFYPPTPVIRAALGNPGGLCDLTILSHHDNRLVHCRVPVNQTGWHEGRHVGIDPVTGQTREWAR